jgi:ribonuclease D
VIRQAVIAGYVSRDIENYGLLKITDAGRKFLEKPSSFQIVEDRDYSDTDAASQMRGGMTSAVDPALFSMLKDLRKKVAKKLNLPPYVIFQDPSLEAMATIYPQTIKELENIPGVGAGKAKRYGEEFCKLIKKHCEDNEIERPEDLRIRTVANKSKLKVSIIQSIDRKVMLDDLAEAKGIDFSELLDEIEAIVYSGTKINIDYFIEEILDDEHIEDILTTIGSPASATEIMAAKVDKEIRNDANRATNCDIANLNKTLDAVAQQTEAIEKLVERGQLKMLPEKLQETVQLRLANPEMSLAQLANMFDPPISKSCLNHRMRKIMEVARNVK